MGLFGKKKAATAAAEAAAEARAACEIIAVIAAAICEYESDQYAGTLSIRKTDRAAGTRPAWGVMGMQEAIDTRRI